MYKPSTYLEVAYFPTYLPMYETYFLQNWLPRWNQILTQLRFIHNWVITDIQWMVCWWVLVHCGPQNSALTIGIGKKWWRQWWQTVLEREISCSEWEGSACPHERSNFFLKFLRGWGRGFFFLFFSPFFPMCSPPVPRKFPKCSQICSPRCSQ